MPLVVGFPPVSSPFFSFVGVFLFYVYLEMCYWRVLRLPVSTWTYVTGVSCAFFSFNVYLEMRHRRVLCLLEMRYCSVLNLYPE